MSHQNQQSQRRTFLRTAATGAVLGSTTLAFAENSPNTGAASSIAAQLPDTVRGDVLRTDGTLSLDQRTFMESRREIPGAGQAQVIVTYRIRLWWQPMLMACSWLAAASAATSSRIRVTMLPEMPSLLREAAGLATAKSVELGLLTHELSWDQVSS